SATGSSQGLVGFAPPAASVASRGDGRRLLAGGDGRVPGDSSGDDDEELAEQGGGDGGAGLAVAQRVVGAGAQVGVAGGVDGVGVQGAPDGPPRRGAQAGAAPAGDLGLAGEGARFVGAGAQPGVFDPGAGAVVAGGVAGLGQDRGGAHSGEPIDAGDQVGEVKGVENLDHAGFDIGDLVQGAAPVPQRIVGSFDGCGSFPGDAVGFERGGPDRLQDAVVAALAAPAGQLGAHDRSE